MIDIDPELVTAWGEPDATHRLRLEVDDPVGAWAPLCDALDAPPGVPTEALPRVLSEPVVAPGGLVFRCENGDVGLLVAWADALADAGVDRGRLTLNRYPAEREVALDAAAGRAAWLVAWLVPRLTAGVDFGYRSLRGWRVRRFPPTLLPRLAGRVGAKGTAVPVASTGGTFEIVGHDLAGYAEQWLEHGVATASFPGSPAAPGAAAAPCAPGGSPVLVTTVRRGAEMVGVGHAAPGLIDDADRAAVLLVELTDLVVELADDLAYAVIGVHETGTQALRGTPFREQVPATARALHGGLSLSVLDQWVLDAGPVQLLTPHHQVSGRDGIDLGEIKGSDRRLLRVGEPSDWFSGPVRRSQVRNRGREALAAGLPPRRTPLPPPLV